MNKYTITIKVECEGEPNVSVRNNPVTESELAIDGTEGKRLSRILSFRIDESNKGDQ